MSQTLITREDVLQVANDLGFKPTKEQILEVIEMYPSEQDADPTGTWDLVIEQCLSTLGVDQRPLTPPDTQLVFDKGNSRVVTADDNQVFYTTDTNNPDNDCPDDVVEVVVQMYNEGKSLKKIDTYLLDANCTQDAREIMIEGLYQVYYPKIYLMMGSFTFLEERYDGEFKTIINRIDAILVFDTDEEAEIYAEEQLDNGMFEGYLIPQVYSGKIEM